MSSKRVVILADGHCGSRTGLTPPKWQTLWKDQENEDSSGEYETRIHEKFQDLQKDLWGFYINTINKLKPIDLLIYNGDAIEGKGTKSGGTELITSNCITQADMAIKCIKVTEAKDIVMTYGTGYHVGDAEDFEILVAKGVGANKIGSHEWVKINNVTFDIKHHVGSSQVPYARHTNIAKDRMWNLLWNEHDEQPKSDIVIRSHCHYYDYCGGKNWLAMTTPALQGPGTKFGSRRCSGTVDFGLIHFDIEEKGRYTWQSHIANIPSLKAQILKI
jgi:hypothetical protein